MKTLHVGWGLLLFAGASWSQQYTITTVAGGAPPLTPAPALTTSIGNPEGTATDAAGNLYFTSLNCVFRMDVKGVVTRVAGNSRAGFAGDGGAATQAQLAAPNGLAVDGTGNIYVADTGNSRIRKVSNGIITTIAGGGSASPGDGGQATLATLYGPNGVAVDGQGNTFIADSNNNRIRKVAANGVIATIAGNGTMGASGVPGTATSAELSQPQYVAVDSQGNLYISDTGNNRVLKVSTGTVALFAGNGAAAYSGDSGPAASAALQTPEGIAVDASGNVFLMDAGNYRIRKVSTAGSISTVAGTGGNGSTGDGGAAVKATLNGSYGLAIDAAGDLFLADYYSYSIREVSSDGNINTVAGTDFLYSGDGGPATSAQFGGITGVAADAAGNLFIADNSRVRRVGANGIVTTVAGNGMCCGPGPSGLPATSPDISPERVAVDASGNLYISDFFSVVHRVSANGTITTVAGNGSQGFSGDGGLATSAQLGNSPGGVAVDAAGNIFIADQANNRVRKVTAANGLIATVAGGATAGLAGDGQLATAALLSQPLGVAVDPAGNLYIADAGNNRIRKILASTGVITTIAGGSSTVGDGGPATNAQLQNPQGVAIDGSGNIFIADSANSRIRQVAASTGIITTVAGGTYGYSGDCGLGNAAGISYPEDLAVDGSGNVFLADSGNSAVRRLQPTSRPTLVCAVVDGASESAIPITPGKIVVIYGTGMGPSTLVSNAPVNGAFGAQLGGTAVSFNGVPAPLIYTSAGQVSAIVPYEVTGSAAQATVSYQGASSTFAVPVAAAAPSFFTSNGSGAGLAASVNNADGTINSAANPVKVGAYIQLYATGEGLTSPPGSDGALAPTKLPLPAPVLQVSVTVGGLPATVAYAGATPGAVEGLMQIDVQIPSGVAAGNQVPVVLQVGTAMSAAGVWIAVSGN